jgi:hypothetical protein
VGSIHVVQDSAQHPGPGCRTGGLLLDHMSSYTLFKQTLLHGMSYSFKLVLRSDTEQMLCTHYEIQIVEAVVTEQRLIIS